MTEFSPQAMRERFAELKQQRESILLAVQPLQEERDALIAANRTAEQALTTAILEARNGLYELDQEASSLSRALNGKTGETVEDA
jgi:hypothetical protein